ncbi:MAG: TetR/AcrR family transcriptional regulator [Rhodospirillales bacterium]
MKARESGDEAETALRRLPSQRRSRERVERLLSCASEMIAAEGSDALKMSEVARRAGVSIGSLYQYFPDKSALVRTLAERYNREGRHCIEVGLAGVETLDQLCDAFCRLIDSYYKIFLAEPVIRDIRSATQADRTLRDMELADSRANGAILAEALVRVRPVADRQALASRTFFIMHLGEATMRLAISVERAEGDALVAAYKRMALTELRRA